MELNSNFIVQIYFDHECCQGIHPYFITRRLIEQDPKEAIEKIAQASVENLTATE
jgi:hypothetical protein